MDCAKLFATFIVLSCAVPSLGLSCYGCVMGDPDGIENDILAGADLDNEVLDPACRGPLNDGSDVTNMTCPDDLQCGMIVISETTFVKRGCIPDTLCTDSPKVFVHKYNVWMNTTCCAGDLCNTLPSPVITNSATDNQSSAWFLLLILAGWRCVTL